MTRVLIIDDEKIYQKMVAHAVAPLGFEIEFADDGQSGLQMALQEPPDVITCDVMMPNLNGYDVVRRLRRDARFAHIPIIILTAQAEINDKLLAFEAGADDHISKPFEPAELVARIGILLKRSQDIQAVQKQIAALPTRQAHVIAVHSLRGGTGSSSMTVNLGMALAGKLSQRVLVADMVLAAGQIALMLNLPLKRTWADIAKIEAKELDWELLQSVILRHDSGLHCLAAPTYPSEAEFLTPELLQQAFRILRANFDVILVDLPHDFSGQALDILDIADDIVALVAPELASVRAVSAALETYRQLAYHADKIHLILNWTFEQRGLQRQKIESALNHAFELILPYAPDLYVEAINTGHPIVIGKPQSKSAEAMRYFASRLHTARNP